MSEKLENKDIKIRRALTELSNRDLDYIEGSWERFSEKRAVAVFKRNRRLSIIKYAAAVLVFLTLTPVIFRLFEGDIVKYDVNKIVVLDNNRPNIENIVIDSTTFLRQIQEIKVRDNIVNNENIEDLSQSNLIQDIIISEKTPIDKGVESQEHYIKDTTVKRSDYYGFNKYNMELQMVDESLAKRGVTRNLIKVGVNLSSAVNSGSSINSSGVNFSAGVNLDIAISDNISFTTGANFERQSVEIKPKESFMGLERSSSWAIPSVRTTASYTNIEIPVNLKWKILSIGGSSYYISGGLSSVLYLNENYTSVTTTQELKEVVELSTHNSIKVATYTYQLQEVKNYRDFSESPPTLFDPIGRVNFSVGMERAIGSGLSLVLEPYIKIPVNEFTSKDLKFFTGGVAFKLFF